jgi:Kef-type K+ transport system membrane component KefB
MNSRNRIAYAIIFSLVFLGIFFIFWNASTISEEKVIETITSSSSSISESKNNFSFYKDQYFAKLVENSSSFVSKTIFQIILILLLSRMIGIFFRRMGQPTVLGEIIAGIFLGPTFLGYFFPQTFLFLFPLEELKVLEILSQIGLILFMFVIGMQIDFKLVLNKVQNSTLVSHTSLLIPFLSGLFVAKFLFEKYAPANVYFNDYSIFMGIAFSITAYPILIKILKEKGLTKTPVGQLALSSSAFGDILAWILLAIVILLHKSSNWQIISFSIVFMAIYCLIMVYIFHPFLKRLSEIYVSRENLTRSAMAIVFIVLFLSSFLTEILGFHFLIGAFFAGVVMPSDQKLKDLISERIDYVALVFFLPLFFALVGLKTNLLLFSNIWSIIALFLIFISAFLSKFITVLLTSRFVGMNWRDSLSLAALMNTRGIMELIIISIAYQMNIFDPVIYTSLVVMTLCSTFLTRPLLKFFQSEAFDENAKQPLEAFRKILISFGQPSMGVALIKLSDFLFANYRDTTQITAIHITPTEVLSSIEELEYKQRSFSEIEELMKELKLDVEMVHKTTENVTYEILNQAKKMNSRFLFIGAAKSLFTKNILGGKIRSILSYAPCNVGVLLDNGLDRINKVLILKRTTNSLGFEKLLYYIQKVHGKSIHQMLVSPFTSLSHEDFNDYQLVIVEIDLWKEREEFLEMEIQSLSSSFLIVQFK